MDVDTRRFLSDLAQFVTLAGGAIALWEATNSVLAVGAAILAVTNVLLLVRLRTLRKRMSEIEAYSEVAGGAARERDAALALSDGMLALSLYTLEEPVSNRVHSYDLVEEEVIFHGLDATYNWRMKGRNVSSHPSQGVVLKMTGDAPADLADLNISVVDKIRKERLDAHRIVVLRDDPCLKIVEISFEPPLPPQEVSEPDFDLLVSLRWPNTVTQSFPDEYVFFPAGYEYKEGIQRYVTRFISDLPLDDYRLERLEHGKLVPEQSQPRIKEQTRGHVTLEYETSRPRWIYMLRLKRQVGSGKCREVAT